MKRLYRSRTNCKIAGICGGLGDYFDIDPTILRLVAIFVLIFTGFVPMTLVYCIAWAVIPKQQ